MYRSLIAAGTFAATGAVLAQPAAAPAAHVPAPPAAQHASFDLALPNLGFASSEIGGRVVKGAPYTADAVTETAQTLADGNRIVRKSTTRLARDSEGRTRQERIGRDGQVASIFINDVVAGKRYMLSPARKTALELPRAPLAEGVPLAPAASADEMRSWAEAMREWARDFAARFRAEHVETRTEKTKDGEVRVTVNRRSTTSDAPGDVAVDVIRVAEVPHVPVPPVPPVPGVAPVPPVPPVPMIAPPPGQGVTTPLGAKEFDGVRADGTRTTWTIPAGRIGNEKPIEIVSERWYSPELMLVVATRHVDPRSGETSYRLVNLKRGEPDAALFKLPGDYELRGLKKRP